MNEINEFSVCVCVANVNNEKKTLMAEKHNTEFVFFLPSIYHHDDVFFVFEYDMIWLVYTEQKKRQDI